MVRYDSTTTHLDKLLTQQTSLRRHGPPPQRPHMANETYGDMTHSPDHLHLRTLTAACVVLWSSGSNAPIVPEHLGYTTADRQSPMSGYRWGHICECNDNSPIYQLKPSSLEMSLSQRTLRSHNVTTSIAHNPGLWRYRRLL